MLTDNKITPNILVDNVVHLLSLPSVYLRLEETLKNPEHNRDDIASIINLDSAIVARVLRIINSAYYALPTTVDNISIAVNLLGEYDLRNLVLLASVSSAVTPLVRPGIDIEHFWQHSIRCGITAKLLAKNQADTDGELLFLSGIIHDLGQLIIYQQEPELADTVATQMRLKNKPRHQVEQALLGFDHAQVGALLATSWGLPDKLCQLMKYHHQPEMAIDYPQEIILLHQADLLTHEIESDSLDTENHPLLSDQLLEEIIETSKTIEAIILAQ